MNSTERLAQMLERYQVPSLQKAGQLAVPLGKVLTVLKEQKAALGGTAPGFQKLHEAELAAHAELDALAVQAVKDVFADFLRRASEARVDTAFNIGFVIAMAATVVIGIWGLAIGLSSDRSRIPDPTPAVQQMSKEAEQQLRVKMEEMRTNRPDEYKSHLKMMNGKLYFDMGNGILLSTSGSLTFDFGVGIDLFE